MSNDDPPQQWRHQMGPPWQCSQSSLWNFRHFNPLTARYGLPKWKPPSPPIGLYTTEKTRFNYVITSLSPEVATEIRDLVLKPPETTPYKEQLIRRTAASERRRLQQLFNPLGPKRGYIRARRTTMSGYIRTLTMNAPLTGIE